MNGKMEILIMRMMMKRMRMMMMMITMLSVLHLDPVTSGNVTSYKSHYQIKFQLKNITKLILVLVLITPICNTDGLYFTTASFSDCTCMCGNKATESQLKH